jgi:hypothetical protein
MRTNTLPVKRRAPPSSQRDNGTSHAQLNTLVRRLTVSYGTSATHRADASMRKCSVLSPR